MDNPRSTRHSLARALTIGLGLALLVGGWLRVCHLDVSEITTDEAFSWRLIQFPLGELLSRVRDDAHPPFYYCLLKAWAVFWGDSLFSMRLLSALLGVAGIAAVWCL